MLRAVIFIVLFLAAAGPSWAARISVSYPSGSDRPLVKIEGELVSDDAELFRERTAKLDKALVAFRSDGGNLLAGLDIGKFIHKKNFTTVVPEDARCLSACALAWLGGAQRYMGQSSKVGFHAAYIRKTGQETGAGNALVGAFLNQLGLSEDAIYYITKAPPTSMTLLNLADAKRLGIDVALIDLHSDVRTALRTNDIPTDVRRDDVRKNTLTHNVNRDAGTEEARTTPRTEDVPKNPRSGVRTTMRTNIGAAPATSADSRNDPVRSNDPVRKRAIALLTTRPLWEP